MLYHNVKFIKSHHCMNNYSDILEYNFHNPQRNFSAKTPRKNPEEDFALQFTESYYESFLKIHSRTSKKNTLFMREVPISGNGIADLLVFSWANDPTRQHTSDIDLEKVNPTVRAFEFKLADWRRGMMQAHRYKYFSHASILVLPQEKLKYVVSQLDTFKKLRVGLWGFSEKTGNISCVFTPRPKQQHIPKYGQIAIQIANQAMLS